MLNFVDNFSLLLTVRAVYLSLVRADVTLLLSVSAGAGGRHGTAYVTRAITFDTVDTVHLGIVSHGVAYAEAGGAS